MSCLTEGVEAGIRYAKEHPVVTGIVLGVVAVGTGGAALAAEGIIATTILSTASLAAGAGATALDTSSCLNGDTAACVGAGLGITSVGISAPETLVSAGIIGDSSTLGGVAGAGLVFGGYATAYDLVTGSPNFLSPLFGC
jgi:hypothetical protein